MPCGLLRHDLRWRGVPVPVNDDDHSTRLLFGWNGDVPSRRIRPRRRQRVRGMSRATRFAGLTLVLGLGVLTACTDDTSNPNVVGGPPASVDPADQARADRIPLVLADMPAGYREEPDDPKLEPGFVTLCFSDVHSAAMITGRAEGRKFIGEGARNISSESLITSTAEGAEQVLATVNGDEFLGCLTQGAEDAMKAVAAKAGDGTEIGSVSVGRLSFPNVADETVAVQVQVEVSKRGFTVPFVADVVLLRKERAISLIRFAHLGSAFPDDQKQALAQAVASRMGP